MPIDDEDDLFNEEFDLVDDDDFDGSGDDLSDADSELDDDADDGAGSGDPDAVETEVAPQEDETAKPKPVPRRGGRSRADNGAPADEAATVGAETNDELDEYGRPKPSANYVVHLYEFQKFRRTIERPFTPEDAEAFATEYNRTGRVYGRFAMAGKNDVKPKKSLD